MNEIIKAKAENLVKKVAEKNKNITPDDFAELERLTKLQEIQRANMPKSKLPRYFLSGIIVILIGGIIYLTHKGIDTVSFDVAVKTNYVQFRLRKPIVFLIKGVKRALIAPAVRGFSVDSITSTISGKNYSGVGFESTDIDHMGIYLDSNAYITMLEYGKIDSVEHFMLKIQGGVRDVICDYSEYIKQARMGNTVLPLNTGENISIHKNNKSWEILLAFKNPNSASIVRGAFIDDISFYNQEVVNQGLKGDASLLGDRILSGEVEIKEVSNGKHNLKYGELIGLYEPEGILKKFQITEDYIEIDFSGISKDLYIGNDYIAKSVKPSILEWLTEEYKFALMYSTAITIIAIFLAIYNWSKPSK